MTSFTEVLQQGGANAWLFIPSAILLALCTAAAMSVRHATKRYAWFGAFMRKVPYFSSALILTVGLYMAFQGWFQFAARGVK